MFYSCLLDALWQQVRDQVPQQSILLERPDPRCRGQRAKHILNPEMWLAYITLLTPRYRLSSSPPSKGPSILTIIQAAKRLSKRKVTNNVKRNPRVPVHHIPALRS